MQQLKTILYCFFLLFNISNYGQELPPIASFLPSTYQADNQNWAISQAENNFLYVANNKGLLEFNGANWRLYPTPNNSIMRSVHAVDGKIYTGAYMDFGVWERDTNGQLNYTSLVSNNINLVEDDQFWTILSFKHWVVFQSFSRIYIYDTKNKSFTTLKAKTKFTKMFLVDNTIYFQKHNEGLYKVLNGQEVLVSNADKLKKTPLINVFKNDQHLVLLTNKSGFFILDESGLRPWGISANKTLINVEVYSGIQTNDTGYAIGTISKGLIFISKKGTIKHSINYNNGLLNNTVLSVFEDKQHNIWAGLDNGINTINLNAPYKIYNDTNGVLGAVYASALHNNILYVGTNQGLFYKPIAGSSNFEFIKGTKGQVWALTKIGNQLFCGHNKGTYIINNKKASLIYAEDGTWVVSSITNKPNLLLQGNYNGLSILEYKAGKWKFRNKIEGFNISSRSLAFVNPQQIFVNHEYKGVFKIDLDVDYTKVLQVSNEKSIQKGLYSSVLNYGIKIIYANTKGVFLYNNTEKTFKKDSVMSQLYDHKTYVSGKFVYEKESKTLWSFSKDKINYITDNGLSATPIVNTVALPSDLRNTISGYENTSYLGNGMFLLGCSAGYLTIDTSKIKPKKNTISINTVSVGTINSPFKLVNKTSDGAFENRENNIEIKYNTNRFDTYLIPLYQFKLEGISSDWSAWSRTSKQVFKNLPFGNYTFKVRAKVANTLSDNEASYSFFIDRPWYLTGVMIAVYVIGIFLFSYFMHTRYLKHYEKQKSEILKKNQKDLMLKELEIEQKLMGLKNEQLQKNIENKNKELAVSTMSLIKKNEFLNKIKDALIEANNKDKNTQAVIDIINRNINNKDDWKFFKEAFNNADKDFLKRVKAKHPSLTPNDLKLCAYLRLNLSSKEIAPLLNISARSVEVKRYRLRKKIELPQGAGLTDYILGF